MTVTVAPPGNGAVQSSGVLDVDGVTVTVVIFGSQVDPGGPGAVMVRVVGGPQLLEPPPLLVMVTVCVRAGGTEGHEVTPATGVVPIHAPQVLELESRAKSGLAFASRLQKVSK